LEDNLKILISNIKNEIEKLEDFKMEVKDKYYSKFHVEYEIINAELIDCLKSSKDALELLINQLENRLNDVFNPLAFKEPPFDKQKLIEIFKKIEQLNIRSNDYTKNLVKEQNEAKKELRLREIFDFINTIQYDNQTSEIASLEAVFEMEKNKKATIKKEIDDILVLITQKQNQLNDEGGAVDKVNEFLNSHFGHQFLTLVAIEFDDDVTGNKKYRFEVQRDGKKAHHLSEGEVSLIAFCYFIAKLKDIKTKGKKPIIWIDDPISSLDSNHIFFIYTLINTQIYGDEEFEQLFISTHNLNFLKYLKRLPGADITKETKTRFRHLIINRSDKNSIIKSMPNFLKNYVTEFNYLFEQIYKCSIMSNVNDSNYTEYYNFGNNARKFLELFLFYKYPDTTTQTQKIKKFFGENNIPSIFTDRINNEYSHLSGCFERGETLIEEPEMYTAAKLIIDRIKYHDIDQYQALVNSVEISFEQA
jgi:wobble nucleotide-excising tRNase